MNHNKELKFKHFKTIFNFLNIQFKLETQEEKVVDQEAVSTNELACIDEETSTVSGIENQKAEQSADTPLICSNNIQSETEETIIFSYTPGAEQETINTSIDRTNQQEDAVSEKEESPQESGAEMMKTALKTRSTLAESKNKYNELDVIDLTQIANQSILITPPPVQFSDDFKQNEEVKPDTDAEIEIESGIESDSSNEQSTARKNTLSSKQVDIIANSEVLTKADKQFLSKLFINLEANGGQGRATSSFNSGSIVPIIHSKFNHSHPSKSGSPPNKKIDDAPTYVSSKLLSKSFTTQAASAASESRVRSFVNAYSSKTSEINSQVRRSNSFRGNRGHRQPEARSTSENVFSASKKNSAENITGKMF